VAELRTLQSKLDGLGFKPGVVDGIAGGRTLDALNRYRASRMLKQVSEIEYATVGGLLD
jgi:peptidoglycan hydrolase-like protein with peptidoglycan-binding domain